MNPTREHFLHHCSDTVSALKREGRYREFARLEKQADRFPIYRWHGDRGVREVVVWSSNDYLGMGNHPAVLGRPKPRSGRTARVPAEPATSPVHRRCMPRWKRNSRACMARQAALLFGSGYIANQAALSTVLSALPDFHVFSDSKITPA